MNERIHHRPVRTQASFAQHRAVLPRTVRSAFSHRKQRHRRAALQPKRLAKRPKTFKCADAATSSSVA